MIYSDDNIHHAFEKIAKRKEEKTYPFSRAVTSPAFAAGAAGTVGGLAGYHLPELTRKAFLDIQKDLENPLTRKHTTSGIKDIAHILGSVPGFSAEKTKMRRLLTHALPTATAVAIPTALQLWLTRGIFRRGDRGRQNMKRRRGLSTRREGTYSKT